MKCEGEMGILVGGALRPCAVPVRLFTETGLEFKPGRGSRVRKDPQLDLMVWHWTGGEGEPEQVFRILQARGYGVEFAIGSAGDIWQFADPLLVDTFDAGKANRRSAGVEITNYGFQWRRPIPRKGRDRPTYQTRQNGRRRTFARFRPAQVAAAIALAEAMSNAIPTIPRRVPRDRDLEILARTMTSQELRAFSGHLGHYHVSRRKSDPGLDLLQAFGAVGF